MNQPRPDNPLEALTVREAEVQSLMAEGLGNVAIARAIHVTLSTVEKHGDRRRTSVWSARRTAVMTSLGARTRFQAALFAQNRGCLT
jgi:DNA-binding NarL/FixJ family response regulator